MNEVKSGIIVTLTAIVVTKSVIIVTLNGLGGFFGFLKPFAQIFDQWF
jgi:hypothetical protein